MQPVEAWQHADARRYFRGEWLQGFAWLGAGIVLGVAAMLVRGTAQVDAFWPLVAVAAIQLAAGIWLIATSRARPDKIRDWDGERTRLTGVLRTFVILELVWIVAILGATATSVLLERKWLGLGIAAAGAAMFLQDTIAHRRAKAYADSLDRIPAQRAEHPEP